MKMKSASQTSKPSWKYAILFAITGLALLASPRSHAEAALCNSIAFSDWINPGTGDWFDASNWIDVNGQHSLPICISPTSINNGGTAHISTTAQTAYACTLVLGLLSTPPQSGNLSVDHGTLQTCNEMTVGHQGKGTVKITNTDSSVTNTFGATIGEMAGSSGSVSVDAGGKWTVGQGLYGVGIYVGGTNTGAGGVGLVSVTNGGSVNAASVYVWKSGTLTGNGTVTTTSGTTIEGTLAPSGQLTIGSNLTFAGIAPAMQCNVVPASADNVNITSGTATLSGRLSVTMTGTFTQGTQYTLLTTDLGRNGFFSSYSIKFPPGQNFSPQINYDTNHVYLYLAPNTGP